MENINLIRKMAWSFHSTTGISYDELFSESALAYYEAKEKYTPEMKTKLTTWAFMIIKNRLINFCKSEKMATYLQLDNVNDNYITEYTEPFFELYDELSNTSKIITDEILNNRQVYSTELPKTARGEIVIKLREKGWSWPKIWDSIRTIKTELAINN